MVLLVCILYVHSPDINTNISVLLRPLWNKYTLNKLVACEEMYPVCEQYLAIYNDWVNINNIFCWCIIGNQDSWINKYSIDES